MLGEGERISIMNSTGNQPSPASPGDFTLVDVQAPLGHVAHAPLRLLSGESVEVINIGSLSRDLKITDAAVALATHARTKSD